MIVGGDNISAKVLAGGTADNPIIEISDIDVGMVYSTEVGGARSWVTTEADLGALRVSGYDLVNLNTAALQQLLIGL